MVERRSVSFPKRMAGMLRGVCGGICGVLLLIAGAQARAASSIRTVYIVPTSHYDFGFVEPPEAVRERAARHISEVIRVAQADPDFRWTIESVWQVNEWLKRAKAPTSVLPKDEARIAALINLIKSGRLALSAVWGSMHTDFMGVEELNRLCYDYVKLKRAYGITTELAVMDDVPGHPMSLPSVLSASGVRYLLVGANLGIGLGGTSLAPGRVPFYWEGPDGARVLTWVSQTARGGYTEALTDYYLDPFTRDPYTGKTPYEMFNPHGAAKAPLQIMEEGVRALLKRYAEAGYPYDAVLVMYAHDFLEPSNVANLERAVRLWNGARKSPRLKIATPPEFFRYIESKYGARLPTYRGEWSGLWSEAKTHSPQLSALARAAHDWTPAAETLWSAVAMTRPVPHPVGNFSILYDLMFTYDEHSGAGNTGWPKLNSFAALQEQNRQYVAYLTRARAELHSLFEDGLRLLSAPMRAERRAESWHLLVYNPLSWARTDLVEAAPPEEGKRIVAIYDEAERRAVAFDIDERGRALFIAHDVPSVGYKIFRIEVAPGAPVPTLKSEMTEDTLESQHYRVRVRADGTIQSIFSLAQRRELVDGASELPFNYLLRTEGDEPSMIALPLAPQVRVERGAVIKRAIIERPRSAFPRTVITLYDDLDRLDLRNEIDASRLPFVANGKTWHDSYFFVFPFALDASSLVIRPEGQRGFLRLPDDYLPGARRDGVTSQHVIALSDKRGALALAHRQSFHFVFHGYVRTARASSEQAFPAIFTGKWPLERATLFAKAFRYGTQSDTEDVGVANIETVEPGLGHRYLFDYSLASFAQFDPVASARFGWELNVPLRAVYIPAVPEEAKRSLFGLDQSNVLILAIKPSSTNDLSGMVTSTPLAPQANRTFILRLQEIAGRRTRVRVSLPVGLNAARVLSLDEDRVIQASVQTNPLTVELGPYEIVTVEMAIARP